MAEIDKGLPNVRREINIPSVEEQTEVIADLQQQLLHMKNWSSWKWRWFCRYKFWAQGAVAPETGDNHYMNLADLLPDSILDPLRVRALCKLYGLQRI